MHTPYFNKDLTNEISNYIYTDFLELQLCDETFDYDDFCDLIDDMTEYFFEMFEHEFRKYGLKWNTFKGLTFRSFKQLSANWFFYYFYCFYVLR